MKKVLLGSLISLALSTSLAQAKFFIGVDAGYEMNGSFTTDKIIYGSEAFKKPIFSHAWVVGVNLGTEHSITDHFGLRWFFGANYSRWFDPDVKFIANGVPRDSSFNAINLELGVDALLNFVNTGSASFGVFVGVGGNVATAFYGGNLDSDLITSFGYAGGFGRAGLTLSISERHRFDLTAHIPIVQTPIGQTRVTVYNPLRFTLGYKVLF